MFWPPKPKLFESATSIGLVARGVRNIVEVAVGIGILEVDRGRHHAITDREQANDRLDDAAGGDQVARHALGARNRDRVSRFAEGAA